MGEGRELVFNTDGFIFTRVMGMDGGDDCTTM